MLVSSGNGSVIRPQMPETAAHAGAAGETKMIRDVIRDGVRVNARLGLATRAMLIAVALVALASALLFVHLHAGEMAGAIGASGGVDGARLLALSLPVLLFGALAALAAAAAWTMHRRGQDELCQTLDVLTRLKREEGVGVSARGLMFAFEEQLHAAHSAFTLLLWLGRTLFIVCLGLFGAAVVNAIALRESELLTLALGATSLGGALLAVVCGVPDRIRASLADVVLLQSIVAGGYRRISLLESAALAALNHEEGDDARRAVLDIQERVGEVVALSVELIPRAAARPAASD
jgi:hypothetical protein